MKHLYVISSAELRNILKDNSIQAITMIHDYDEENKIASMVILGENESRNMSLKGPIILKGIKTD